MGYRSEVAIALPKKEMDRLFEAAKAASHTAEAQKVYEGSTPERLLKYADRLESSTALGDWSVIHFQDIKWYTPFYRDENFVMDFVEQSENVQFIRLGEDPSDVEELLYGEVPDEIIYIRHELCFVL